MVDREKVIKGLECCKIPFTKCYNGGCPYFENDGCKARLKSDALALLKEQKPRLVTKDDFENADEYGWLPAWGEEKTGGSVYCECILIGALKEKGIRYWTSRPTDEQREATPWN